MKKISIFLGIALASGIFITFYINDNTTENATNNLPAVEKTPAVADYKVSYLDQNWSDEIRNEWWYTPQGSWLIPYDWFRVLEQADNEEPLNSAENMKRLGFIPGAKNDKWNPNSLPIGFVKDVNPTSKELYLGVTCAACHTGLIEYQGKQFIVEGGPALADFDRFITEIAKTLQATLDDDDKFKRLADNYFDGNYDPDKATELKDRMAKVSAEFNARIERNRPPHPNGYGRLDAFGNIFNEVVVTAINEPDNVILVNAPVSYPVLWDTPHHDVVQWNGAAINAGIGPYVRNAGEVIGVFGGVHIEKATEGEPGKLQYLHHIDLENLKRLEDILVTLWSPVWPETLLPAIDQTKVEQGKNHYDKLCSSCHEAIDRKDPNRQIQAKIIPLKEIGTDSQMVNNSADSTSKTGMLEGQPLVPLPNMPAFGPQAASGALVGNAILNILFQELPTMLGPDEFQKSVSEFLQAKAQSGTVPLGYKARPLNGIWASAPFLHNGSVANLWELLKKPNDRMQQFHVGSSELDPVHVGFNTDNGPLTSKLDTALPGNSNQGHNYGTDLSDASKLELIEYIKTL
ncbi:MAG: hypothetical protein COB30_016135 [Ectothiorhodospiraceae bacterium]|nr:hypothetical protein [Ectothiorhodospiraceae bacterium]